MLRDIDILPNDTAVIIQPCGHNPTGVDPNQDEWDQIFQLFKSRPKLLPIIDMAQYGFASGSLYDDNYIVRRMSSDGMNFIICNSYSKNFGLYGERVGDLHVFTNNENEAISVQSNLNFIARINQTAPPLNGARIVYEILSNEGLFEEWIDEVETIVSRMKDVRMKLKHTLERIDCRPPGHLENWDHIIKQTGMFCFTGLSEDMCSKLVDEYEIYMLKNGRMSVSGLNNENIN